MIYPFGISMSRRHRACVLDCGGNPASAGATPLSNAKQSPKRNSQSFQTIGGQSQTYRRSRKLKPQRGDIYVDDMGIGG